MTHIPDWVNQSKEELNNPPASKSGELSSAERALAYSLISIEKGLLLDLQKELFSMVVLLLESAKSGSTRLEYDAKKWLEVAPRIVGSPGLRRPIIYTEGGVFTERNYRLESDLSENILSRFTIRLEKEKEEKIDNAIDEVKLKPTVAESGAKLTLSGSQWNAIQRAISHRLSIISGGPGTGKTSIIVTLLRILVRIGIDPKQIVLAAPTGKAASRMNESIQAQLGRVGDMSDEDSKLREHLSNAQTIHRILKYSIKNRKFQRDADEPVRAQFLIVDEASMIDLGLMKALFDATPKSAQVVLVGDARQLPSVEVGAVLRDLVGSKTLAPAVGLLHDSYRVKASGADILKAASDIDHGRTDAFFEKCVTTEHFLGRGISILVDDEQSEKLHPFLDRWFDREFMNKEMVALRSRTFHCEKGLFSVQESKRLDDIFSQFRRAKILCATRVWKTGSTSINAFLHKRLLTNSKLSSEFSWLVGEPVLMTKNNYEQHLFNGEQGVILFVKTDDHEPKAMVVFSTSDGYRPFSLGGFSRQIESAFAITTHKSQGSEFDDVALILPGHISKIVSRELIYTAITRARRSVIILGSSPVLSAGIKNSNSRATSLGQQIDAGFLGLSSTTNNPNESDGNEDVK